MPDTISSSSRISSSSIRSQPRSTSREMEGSQRRFSSLEEALEIKSLRRIISAYLNYSDAAEEDVRRSERSFTKLSPQHKALLSHLPLKHQRLRRCISENAIFIMNMLQAFDPPFNMCQDVDFIGDGDLENHPDSDLSTKASQYTKACSTYPKQLLPESGSSVSELELSSCSGGCDHYLTLSKRKEITSGDSHSLIVDANTRDCHSELIDENNDVKFICNLDSSPHDSSPNGSQRLLPTDWMDASLRSNVPLADVDKQRLLPTDWMDASLRSNVPLVDVDKVRCIIRNIVRDWAVEGQIERDKCYKPILEELIRLFPVRCKERPPCCLVPGAGLGRLALEISSLGFVSQGNEFSYYMMICSSFILNQTEAANQWVIYPWIHSNCNSLTDDDQFRPVSFPDIHPACAGITEGFSMCGGDFVEVYSDVDQEASWDAVVTCFFLDTAHNIVEYIEVISKILKVGGVWINLGPLLYHFADSYGPEEEMSIEISLEDVIKIALQYGFELEMEKMVATTYTANPLSMMQNHYYTAFWTMRKKLKT